MHSSSKRIILLALLLPSSLLFAQRPLHSIDVSDLDRKAEPCTDFFQFANGTWRANNPIPASMTRWSKRWQSGESAKDRLKDILEAASSDKNAPQASTERIIGDYYGACMDESRVNARGMEPIKPWFAKIDAARDMAALQQVMAEMHDILVQVPFSFGSQQDPHKPSLVLADIGASGLGLPDRDYYLKPEPRFKEAREKYVEHVTTMFKLAGWDQKTAAAAAQTIMGIETKLAEASLDNVALRDPAATDHNTTFAQLQAMAPHFDWTAYFEHKQIATDVDINVDEPKFMQEVDRQMQQTPLPDWKVYLKWQLLNSVANSLSDPFVEENFAFNGKYLARRDRDEAALEALRRSRPTACSARRSARSTSRGISRPRPRRACRSMVKNLLAAMGDTIRQPRLDERRDQGEGAGEARHLQSEDRLSRQVEGLQPASRSRRDRTVGRTSIARRAGIVDGRPRARSASRSIAAAGA